jgi:hypothetical protein
MSRIRAESPRRRATVSGRQVAEGFVTPDREAMRKEFKARRKL